MLKKILFKIRNRYWPVPLEQRVRLPLVDADRELLQMICGLTSSCISLKLFIDRQPQNTVIVWAESGKEIDAKESPIYKEAEKNIKKASLMIKALW